MRPCGATRAGTQRRFHTKNRFCASRIIAGDERWMRPCGATRAGTQAPPLPIPVIFFDAIPHKPNNHLRAIFPKRNQPSMCNPSLPISTKPRGVPLPHRGYTFDSAGLASATQPTLGNDASEEATPLGVVLFLIAHHYHTRRMISLHEN